MIVGVRGSKRIVAEVEMARGSVNCEEGRRQGAVPVRLLGEIVRAIAYERRR